MALEPFRIEFGEREIEDLHRRIDATRWPSITFETGWSTGTDDGVLRELVRYWRHEFDWFVVQESLNSYQHLRGPVGGGEALHCIRLSRDGDGRMPLLLLHGWPGSFIELLPAAERLSAAVDGGPGFDVVVPSLPGYGFSEAPREPGMHPGRIAERMHALMRELGYERFGVQGGDWGAQIAGRVARQQPESVIGLHLNLPAGLVGPAEGETRPPEEVEQLEQATKWRELEGAYGQLQGTKPQTLGYALTDSPVGQLAWILEKFWAWSDHGEDLWETFDRDAVLANVTLYWLTGTALSSARLYYERRRETPPHHPEGRLEVPTAYARYPAEIYHAPRSVFERSYRLVRWSEMPRGGHFAALEQPELFSADVAEFFASLEEVG